MKWNRLQKRILLSVFIIIILSIIVYHICDQYKYVTTQVDYHLKPPPKTKIDSLLTTPEELEEYSRLQKEIEEFQNPPPPPRPVGYTVRHLHGSGDGDYFYKTDQSSWLDDTVETFVPNETDSTLTSFSSSISSNKKTKKVEEENGEPVIEGFVELSDFFAFLDFLFQAVIAMICISLTLPIHIFEYIIGMIIFVIAFFWFLANFIGNIFITFMDFNQMMNDISRCGMTMSKNLPFCFVWYMIDLLGYFLIMIFVWLPTAIVRIVTFGKLDLNNLLLGIIGVKGSGYRDTNGNRIERDGIFALVTKKIKPIIGFDPIP